MGASGSKDAGAGSGSGGGEAGGGDDVDTPAPASELRDESTAEVKVLKVRPPRKRGGLADARVQRPRERASSHSPPPGAGQTNDRLDTLKNELGMGML